MFPVSSMAERSAVNRNVGSSNLPRGDSKDEVRKAKVEGTARRASPSAFLLFVIRISFFESPFNSLFFTGSGTLLARNESCIDEPAGKRGL